MTQEGVVEWPVHCPYCDAPFTMLLDISADSYTTWEDCAVCCQPIQVAVAVSTAGELEDVTLASDDDVM
ncbi:CPXCG motif-containing cysteine-rich protein [Salinicola aestuarinus]|uniref:CPXCG motif-containing cysteine-rich protein n=1 Tax=Salinicola aestuarinus TaxID=1949082 RepID=UPI000DA16712|nr:CPXCG motif-containing cysteine-rich protein [Salinicola aestuarinus]